MILVTSYEHPDLDGVACSLGYAQLLTATRTPAQAVLFGNVDQETRFVMDRFNIPSIPDGASIITPTSDVILVDSSDAESISPLIHREKVVEIIDHRKLTFLEMFPNAKAQVELVGSCATLIAEKYHAQSITPRGEATALLYSAIVSNTVNFRNTVSTPRDRAMAQWLAPMLNLPTPYVHDMFVAKSQIQNLEEVLANECAVYSFGNARSSIYQLELVNAEAFVNEHFDTILSVMNRLKEEKKLTTTFLSIIDIEAFYNLFIVIDSETQRMLEQLLNLTFRNGQARREGIIMRKELFPMVKECLLRVQ